MNHYRLLRDNKETGPFSQEELILKGFKPYDLLWVEGKSAGWRYPSEIEELKKFASVVEEQPYDRFYKKPTTQKSVTLDEKTNRVSFTSTNSTKSEELPGKKAIKEPAYTIQPAVGRHIHVTLPSGNTVNVTTINTNTGTAKKEVVEEKIKYMPSVVDEKPLSFTQSLTEKRTESPVVSKPVTVNTVVEKETEETNYHLNTATYTQSAQGKSSFSWTTALGLVVGVAALVGLGVMIGLAISKQPDTVLNTGLAKKTKQPQTNLPSPVATPPSDKTADISQGAVQPVQQDGKTQDNKELVSNAVIKTAIPASSGLKEDKHVSGAASENIVESKTEPVIPKKSAAVPVADLEKQLNVTNNSFKIGAFGGISDLQCTLVNDSKFLLDVVEVEVQYIQANDKVYKTEKLSFKDIAPGTQVTLVAPKSPRGVKVVSRIVKINSKESGLLNTTVKN